MMNGVASFATRHVGWAAAKASQFAYSPPVLRKTLQSASLVSTTFEVPQLLTSRKAYGVSRPPVFSGMLKRGAPPATSPTDLNDTSTVARGLLFMLLDFR